ncbi:TPA: tRNA pseudouridine(13) synthase TruD, partial [Candidatus Woesearchaeota archaeon]|nr:tRNA pseudouridine(13) synthase TruD [Candidatus Woesearchaeota archaeon]
MLIKSIPEDFIVEEIPIEFSDKGDYSIYKLTKKDFNTESAVEHICNKFNIPRKNIKYAGSKDRHALTTQFISIFKDKGNLKIDTDNIKLGFISFHNEPLSLGSLKGNKFIIKIRDLSEEELNNFKTRFSDDYVFPNYFDDQ